eukprot:2290774-Lingulodinium_polyedra.AAC.1
MYSNLRRGPLSSGRPVGPAGPAALPSRRCLVLRAGPGNPCACPRVLRSAGACGLATCEALKRKSS